MMVENFFNGRWAKRTEPTSASGKMGNYRPLLLPYLSYLQKR